MSDPRDLENLLREGPWLRRLAMALVGEHGGAEDLAQEVTLAALRGDPPVESHALRSWLRTVARRKLGRRRERERLRSWAEQADHGQEGTADPVTDRLAIQESIARALARVAEPYRSAVVLRYFDELSTAEVADRLGLSNAAVRQRVSRGLARLREELDAEHRGDRSAWLALLVPVVPEGNASAPPPGSSSLPLTSLAIVMSTRWLVSAGIVVTLALFGSLLLMVSDRTRMDASSEGAGRAELDGADVDGGQLARVVEPDARRLAMTDAPRDTALVGARARVRIVGEGGEHALGTEAIWISAQGDVVRLDLDDRGFAERPPGFARGVIARAPGYALTWQAVGARGHRLEGAQEDLVVELDPGRTIRGVVTENGVAPLEPVALHFDLARPLPISLPRRTWDELRTLGFVFRDRIVTTGPSGTFSCQALSRLHSDAPQPTSTHGFAEGVEAREGPADFWTLDLERRSTVRGRFVFEDTGEPVGGSFMCVREPGTSGEFTPEWALADGRFAIGMGDTRRAGPDQVLHVLGLEHPLIRFEPIVIALHGASLPVDVGDVPIRREESMHFEVIGRDGEPLGGAMLVAVGGGSDQSDGDGRARLVARPGDEIFAVAADHALGSFVVEPGAQDARRPQRLLLQAGPTLRVTPLDDRTLGIRLTWRRSPFAGAGDRFGPVGPVAGELIEGLSSVGYGGDSSGVATAQVRTPPFGDLVLSGLVPDARLRIEAVDSLGQPLVGVSVEFRDGRDVSQRLDLTHPGKSATFKHGWGTLRVRAVLSSGDPVPEGATITIGPAGHIGRRHRADEAGELELTLRHGPYDVEVLAHGRRGRRTHEAFPFTSITEELTVTFEP